MYAFRKLIMIRNEKELWIQSTTPSANDRLKNPAAFSTHVVVMNFGPFSYPPVRVHSDLSSARYIVP